MMKGRYPGPGFKVDCSDPNPNNHSIIPIPGYVPALPTVTERDINQRRRELEDQPLSASVGGATYTLDYDAYSREILAESVANWDYITNTKVVVDEVEYIAWKDAFNEVQLFSQPDFVGLVGTLKIEAAKRSDRLHAHARSLVNQLPDVTEADIAIDQWP